MKKSFVACSVFVTALTLFSGFSSAQEDAAEALEVVEGVVQQFVDVVSQQDAAAMGQLFTEDGQYFQESTDLRGRATVQEFFQLAFDAGLAEVSAPVTEAGLLGDTAYSVGAYVTMDAQGGVTDEGTFVGIYKQEGGKWRYHRFMATSSLVLENTMSGRGAMSGGGN